MTFAIDSRILSTSIWIYEGNLSTVFLKNDASFLWFILVPRVENIKEIYQLTPQQRHQLIEEIAFLSKCITEHGFPDKLNVGALGNIVSQLHIHVIARFEEDVAWPHGVWQPTTNNVPYEETVLKKVVKFWQDRLQ